MNNNCQELISQWLCSSRQQVDPPLLAQVLLYITKDPAALPQVIDLIESAWHEKDHYKCVDLLTQMTVHGSSGLQPNSVDMLIKFICNHLADNNNAPPVVGRFVDMIYALVSMTEPIRGQHAVQLCEVILTHVRSQSLHRDTRYKLLLTMDKILHEHVHYLRLADYDFVAGFITLIDGEKDPRNLLQVFSLVKVVISNFDISLHVEDLFDSIFCYFPISFTPPPNDPYGISTQQLKNALREALGSTPYFANFATPLLIEKVMTATGSAKSDAIETIGLCAPAYGAHALLPHANDLFKALSTEVCVARSPAMEEISLSTIRSVVGALASGICIADIRESVEHSLRSLLDPCIAQLEQPELKNAKSAAHILCAAASAADPSCSCIVHSIAPMLTRLFRPTDSPVRLKAILDVFNSMLQSHNRFYSSSPVALMNEHQDTMQSPLYAYKAHLVDAFLKSIYSNDDSVRLTALEGLQQMVSLKQFLSQEELHIFIKQLMDLYLRESNDKISNLALDIFSATSRISPAIAEQHILPFFIDHTMSSASQSQSFEKPLRVIDVLASQPYLSRVIIPSLFAKLHHLLLQHQRAENDDNLAHALCRSILSALKLSSKQAEIMEAAQLQVYPFILAECAKSSLRLPNSWRTDKALLHFLALIQATILRGSSISFQEMALDQAYRLFLDGDFSTISPQLGNASRAQHFGLWDGSNVTEDMDISVLFPAIVGNCRKEAKSPIQDCLTLLQQLGDRLIDSRSNMLVTQKMALVRTIASIANKCSHPQMPDTIKFYAQSRLVPLLQNASYPSKSRLDACLVTVWLAKALLLRGQAVGMDMLNVIMDMLSIPEPLALDVAQSFTVLLQDDELVLTRASFANVSILYKQRIFYHCIPMLISRAESTSSEAIRYNHLCAFSYIIINLPIQVITNEVHKFIGGFIASLKIMTLPDLLISLLHVTEKIVPGAIGELTPEHLNNLVEALLTLGTFNHHMIVRIAALQALSALTTRHDGTLLHTMAPRVIRQLAIALDDKKRQVRRVAVTCRANWFALIQ